MDLAELAKAQKIATAQNKSIASSGSGGLFSELGSLFTGDHINASGGVQYSRKNFGRDSAVSMLFLLDSLKRSPVSENRQDAKHVIEQVIKSLVHWQGQKDAKIGERWRKNAEEKGKIHHEAGPVEIDEVGLVGKWQEDDDKGSDMLVYYGSVDSTPLFVRLACEYVEYLKQEDPSSHSAYSFLLGQVYNYRGFQVSILESIQDALTWVAGQLTSSDLGLLEYQRHPGQEQSLPNQTWKDSLTSFVHLNGELANTNRPVASIEIQGLAYDALLEAAEMFEKDPVLASAGKVHPTHIESWKRQADGLRQAVLKQFWLDGAQRFIQAIDRDSKTGLPRQLKVPSSDELHLLNSRLFDSLGEQEKQPYLQSLVSQALSGEFLTGIGIRCRAKSMRTLIDFADYHGSWAVWPWESHWIALGLRRQGFARLADEIDTRIVNAFTVTGDYLEYYLADPTSDVVYYRFTPLEWSAESWAPTNSIIASTLPDTPQTWSLTAAIDIRATLFSSQQAGNSPSPWITELENDLLFKMKRVSLLTEGAEISKLREASPVALIDRLKGRAADKRYHKLSGSIAPTLLPAV